MSDMSAPVPMPVVPARLRFVLYWTSYFLSMAAGLISVAWQIIAASSPDIAAPMWVKLAPAIMLLVVAQLNGLSGSNVTAASSVVVRREEGGSTMLVVVGAVLLVLGIIVVGTTTANLLGILMALVGAAVLGYAIYEARTGVHR